MTQPIDAKSPQVCAQCESNAKSNEAGGYYKSAKECREFYLRGHRPPDQHVAPQRIWTQLYSPAQGHGIVTIAAYNRDPREVHDNGKPVYEYARIAPIRTAAAKCEDNISNQLPVESNYILIRKSDWEALKDAINK